MTTRGLCERWGGGLLLALATAVVAPTATAAVGPSCLLGGPAPGSRVLSLHLPGGADYAALRLTGTRSTRPISTRSDWHLVQGVFLLTARTHRLLGYRISADGANPARTVVRTGAGPAADEATPGPGAPFTYSAGTPLPELAPGDYVVIGFGSSGNGDARAETWGAQVLVSGAGTCRIRGAGRVFDHDAGDFTGGANVSVAGAGAFDDSTLRTTAREPLTVGVMQATTQADGTAILTGTARHTAVRVHNAVAPFVLPGGSQMWRARASGVFPVVDVAGVAVAL